MSGPQIFTFPAYNFRLEFTNWFYSNRYAILSFDSIILILNVKIETIVFKLYFADVGDGKFLCRRKFRSEILTVTI